MHHDCKTACENADGREKFSAGVVIQAGLSLPAARKHKGSVGTSWMYEIDVLRAKDESVDLLIDSAARKIEILLILALKS